MHTGLCLYSLVEKSKEKMSFFVISCWTIARGINYKVNCSDVPCFAFCFCVFVYHNVLKFRKRIFLWSGCQANLSCTVCNCILSKDKNTIFLSSYNVKYVFDFFPCEIHKQIWRKCKVANVKTHISHRTENTLMLSTNYKSSFTVIHRWHLL